jgi:nucleoside-diphosphate-sugar epimerase
MRVFVTGASGFIGSAVIKELLDAGHEVTGLVRSKQSADVLEAVGVRGHIGSIEDVESLRKGAADAEGAIHTAFFHQITHMSLPTRLRVMLGGSPSGMVSRFVNAAVSAEKRAIEAAQNQCLEQMSHFRRISGLVPAAASGQGVPRRALRHNTTPSPRVDSSPR